MWLLSTFVTGDLIYDYAFRAKMAVASSLRDLMRNRAISNELVRCSLEVPR